MTESDDGLGAFVVGSAPPHGGLVYYTRPQRAVLVAFCPDVEDARLIASLLSRTGDRLAEELHPSGQR